MFRRTLRLLGWPFGVVRRRPVASAAILLLVAAVAVPVGAHCWALYQFREAGRAPDDDRYDEAHAHISFCLTVWPWSAPTHFLAARIARMSGAYPEATAQLEECRRLQGATADTQLEMLLVRAQEGQVDDVIEGLVYAAEHDPAHRQEILEALARGHMNLMRFPPALALLDRCLKDYPDDVRALDWRGWLLEQLQQQERAVKDYEHVLELSPGRADVRLRLAFLYLAHNDPVLAEPHLRKLDKDRPGRPEVLLGLAEFHFLNGELEETRALLDRVLADHPDEPMALFYLGKVDLQTDRPEEAEAYFRRVLKDDKYNSEAWNGLYDSLRGQPGREAEADDALKNYNRQIAFARRLQELLSGEVEQASTNPEPAYELGKMNLEMGREQLGLYWLNTALKRDKDHKPTHALLADYFAKKGDKEAAAGHHRLAQETGRQGDKETRRQGVVPARRRRPEGLVARRSRGHAEGRKVTAAAPPLRRR